MKNDEPIEYILTAKEAVQLINKTTNKVFHLCVNVPLPIPEKQGYSFPGYSTVKVTRLIAIQFIKDALAPFEERGARIKIREYPNILFIG